MRCASALVLLALFAAACGGGDDERRAGSADAAPTLTDVRRADDFAAAFDGDRGRPRLVVLMSPT